MNKYISTSLYKKGHGYNRCYSRTVQSTIKRQPKYNTEYDPRSRVQAEPKRDHFPHALAFLRGPNLQCARTCTAFRHVGTLQRTELFRNVQRVCMSTLTIAKIMLRRKNDQLCKIASACAGRGADSHGRINTGVRVERKRPLARVREWSTPHAVDNSAHRVCGRFLP